jgi:RimJ/RimL family protein N-acetyltransferase
MDTHIHTSRLYLRELTEQDATALFELDSDPEVHLFLGNQPLKSMEEALPVIQFIRQQYRENGIGRWAVIERESDQMIGWSGFKLIRDTVNGHTAYYDLGYRFMRKHWGKGYATEAAKAMVDYGFNTMGLTEIYAIADLENLASRKVLEKVGMMCKGEFMYDNLPHHWFELYKLRS